MDGAQSIVVVLHNDHNAVQHGGIGNLQFNDDCTLITSLTSCLGPVLNLSTAQIYSELRAVNGLLFIIVL